MCRVSVEVEKGSSLSYTVSHEKSSFKAIDWLSIPTTISYLRLHFWCNQSNDELLKMYPIAIDSICFWNSNKLFERISELEIIFVIKKEFLKANLID
jgi:hypothetical protein